MSDQHVSDAQGESNTLVSRLRVIEDQPLETRAIAFAQVYEELQSRLERSDAASPSA